MTWQILETEPAYGICDQCRKHDCGITEDGKHKWIMTSIEDKYGDYAVFGYKCVETWAANLGISKEIVEKEVKVPPTDKEIAEYIRNAITQTIQNDLNMVQCVTEPGMVMINEQGKDLMERKPVKRKNA